VPELCPLCRRELTHCFFPGDVTCHKVRLAALSRIIRRALACGQLEKLEDARPYLDDEPKWVRA